MLHVCKHFRVAVTWTPGSDCLSGVQLTGSTMNQAVLDAELDSAGCCASKWGI